MSKRMGPTTAGTITSRPGQETIRTHQPGIHNGSGEERHAGQVENGGEDREGSFHHQEHHRRIQARPSVQGAGRRKIYCGRQQETHGKGSGADRQRDPKDHQPGFSEVCSTIVGRHESIDAPESEQEAEGSDEPHVDQQLDERAVGRS